MKNVIRLAAVALFAMSFTVACNSKNEETTDSIDSVADTTMCVVDTIDTTAVVENVVAEEPVKKAVKATAKKAEEKVDVTIKNVQEGGSSQRAKAGEKRGTTEMKTGEKVEPNKLAPRTVQTGGSSQRAKRQ